MKKKFTILRSQLYLLKIALKINSLFPGVSQMQSVVLAGGYSQKRELLEVQELRFILVLSGHDDP